MIFQQKIKNDLQSFPEFRNVFCTLLGNISWKKKYFLSFGHCPKYPPSPSPKFGQDRRKKGKVNKMLWDEYIWDLKLTESNFWVAAFAILVMFFYDYQFGEKQKDKDKKDEFHAQDI